MHTDNAIASWADKRVMPVCSDQINALNGVNTETGLNSESFKTWHFRPSRKFGSKLHSIKTKATFSCSNVESHNI